MDNRMRCRALRKRVMSAEQAATLICDGMTIGTSGFTMASYPKAVPLALAQNTEYDERRKITLITGASVGDELDGALARAGMISRRYPYQSNANIREKANNGEIAYVDMHLSQLPLWLENSTIGPVDIAIIEAIAIDEAGNIIPASSVGISNVLVKYAKRIIVEINTTHSEKLQGVHDIYTCAPAPHTEPIPLRRTEDRIGVPYIPCDIEKIVAVVYSDIPDQASVMKPPDESTQVMAKNLVSFLSNEVIAERMPKKLPPIQSGVGSVGNAILGALTQSSFRGLSLYSEVLQSAVLDLLDAGVVEHASATALSMPGECWRRFEKNAEFYKEHLVLRPLEISNSPEIIRRLGVIAINTAIEVDFSGNVNSTHIGGDRLMNGIGGSGDFARNAGVTIFTTTSTAKSGALSCIVPVVSHVDHTEHDVDIIVTEQGVADLRGKTAYERAKILIEHCAHPDFRPQLREQLHKTYCEHKYHHGITWM